MMGMFVIGALIERWVTINFKPVVSSVPLQRVLILIGTPFQKEQKVFTKL